MRVQIKLGLCVVFVGVFFPAVAWAQASGAPAPTLSLSVAVVMVLSLVLGGLNQIVQSGSLFGSITPDKAWLPDFTIAATFLGGVVGYFNGLTPLVLSGATIFYAIAAGVAALLVGTVPSIAFHAHVVLPAKARALRLQRLRQGAAAAVTGPQAAQPR